MESNFGKGGSTMVKFTVLFGGSCFAAYLTLAAHSILY